VIHIPRIGQEVVVDFLEGDPDQPIIVGSVYNVDMMPPYKLPDNKTQSGVKSRSSLGGGPANFNEIRFEDKKGQEEIHVQAERNLTTTVEGSESRSVGGDRSTTIGNDDTTTVKKGNRTVTIEKGNDKLTIKQGDRDVVLSRAARPQRRKLAISRSTLPPALFTRPAKNVLIEGSQDIKLHCGGSSITINPGDIELRIGGSTINMYPALITIKSVQVQVEAQAMASVKGALTTVEGSGLLQAKGGVVMIG
jgi:type VI secretion system secreted protein VgrG